MIQCHECECFRHIAAECANTIKKTNKSFVARWSDSDSESSKAKEDVSFNHAGHIKPYYFRYLADLRLNKIEKFVFAKPVTPIRREWRVKKQVMCFVAYSLLAM